MGKTAAGAVWLNAEALSPYDYWQFWRNTQDADVGRFMRLFTDLPLDDIVRHEALEGAEINAAKRLLAYEATVLAHGVPAAQMAELTADATFAGGHGDDLPSHAIATEVIGIVDALIALNFVASKGEARRLIAGGGARIDGEKVTDETTVISPGAQPVKVSAGKKQHGLIVR
jgi:tyrosyl-tRNA synthetase